MDYFKNLIDACEGVVNPSEQLISALEDAKKYFDILGKVHKPLGTLVIVKEIEPNEKVNGIFVGQDEEQHYGELIAKGDNTPDYLKIGTTYFWSSIFGEALTIGGEDFFIGQYINLKAEVEI